MFKIKLIQGDITVLKADAIVNAANTTLLGGGGVDGAIHRKGGKKILEDCLEIRRIQGGCKTGEAVYTTGGNLPARYVIHTVGPVWNGGKKGEPELLKNCYKNSLIIAEKLNLESVAFPNISTGVYRFPKELAAEIAVNTVRNYGKIATSIKEVMFVCFEEKNYRIYEKLFDTFA